MYNLCSCKKLNDYIISKCGYHSNKPYKCKTIFQLYKEAKKCYQIQYV